ncbi:MAG: hypothetical protein ABIH99_01150 [Candidatus Micrarchaeota archaeon]
MSRRGREVLVHCESCGRTMPKDKAVSYSRSTVFSTDLKTNDDVKFFQRRKCFYCVSCGKSKGIFQKKRERMMRKYNQ